MRRFVPTVVVNDREEILRTSSRHGVHRPTDIRVDKIRDVEHFGQNNLGLTFFILAEQAELAPFTSSSMRNRCTLHVLVVVDGVLSFVQLLHRRFLVVYS